MNSVEGGTVSFATPEVGVSNTETREWAMQGKAVLFTMMLNCCLPCLEEIV